MPKKIDHSNEWDYGWGSHNTVKLAAKPAWVDAESWDFYQHVLGRIQRKELEPPGASGRSLAFFHDGKEKYRFLGYRQQSGPLIKNKGKVSLHAA